MAYYKTIKDAIVVRSFVFFQKYVGNRISVSQIHLDAPVQDEEPDDSGRCVGVLLPYNQDQERVEEINEAAEELDRRQAKHNVVKNAPHRVAGGYDQERIVGGSEVACVLFLDGSSDLVVFYFEGEVVQQVVRPTVK